MIVSQLTARRDYAIANILHEKQLLDRLFTDAYYNKSEIPYFKILDGVLPSKIVKTYQRYQPRVPSNLISYNWKIALQFRNNMRKNGQEAKYLAQTKAYKKLNARVIEFCEKNPHLREFFGFDTGALEFFEWARTRDFNLVLDQSVAPRFSQINMHKLFEAQYGISTKEDILMCERLKEREEREWDLATTILSPSKYVRDEMIAAGAPEYKIKNVSFGYDSPVPYETRITNFQERQGIKKEKLIVLFAGNAGLRKGINEFVKIASLFKDSNVEFRIAGQTDSEFREKIQKLKLSNITVLGKLPLELLLSEYQKSDIFFLPSYLEGSARVVFEAMSWGIPILTSHETGSVVTHGKEGYLFSAGDIKLMEDSLKKLVLNPDLRYQMGRQAIDTCEKFSMAYYSNNLINNILR